MVKSLQCIIGQFQTEVAILKFQERDRELFTLVCLRIMKHGDPVGDQRIVGLFYYIYWNKLSFIHNCSFSFETTANPFNLCHSRQNLVTNL